MGIETAFRRFEAWLAGWPDSVLTVVLLVAAVVLVLIAFTGKPREKAIAAAYVFFP